MRKLLGLIATAMIFYGLGILTVALGQPAVQVAGRGATADATTPSTVQSAAAPAPAKATRITDGVWTIGVDFPAGTYRTTANVDGSCYWEISKTGGASLTDIISNDIPGGGRPSVTLKKGQHFKTRDCGTWRKS